MAGNEDKNDEKRRERAYRIWEGRRQARGAPSRRLATSGGQHEETEREADTPVSSKSDPSGHDNRDDK